jgi:hypothetical protein
MSWAIRGFTKDCITFIAPVNGKLLGLKNRTAVPEAIANANAAQAITSCTRQLRRVFDKEQKKKEEWARRAKNIMRLLLTPAQVAKFELKGDPTEVNGTQVRSNNSLPRGQRASLVCGSGTARAIHAWAGT